MVEESLGKPRLFLFNVGLVESFGKCVLGANDDIPPKNDGISSFVIWDLLIQGDLSSFAGKLTGPVLAELPQADTFCAEKR